ncbi:MAG: YheC/YheD family protein [Gammaproteobacteria bacterium]|nr:YheC/YheD family protein [Gammaproteobacteria bacterium]
MASIIDFFNIEGSSTIRRTKWIGLFFHTLTITDHEPSWMMRRALLIESELNKNNYKLICFTPANVNLNEKTVTGYMIDNGQFKKIYMPVPKIICEFYFGTTDIEIYRQFTTWALEKKYHIYPNRAISQLAADKLLTAEQLSEYDMSVVPKTEAYKEDIEQIDIFLQKNNKVFVKPRFGNMGNGIFVLKNEDNRYIITYYNKGKSDTVIFNTLSDCIFYISKNSENRKYIIQEAINVLKFSNSVFDLRVIMFNDEKSWHFLSEVRLGKISKELSNIHQGGKTYFTDEFFNKVFGKEHADYVLQKIKNTSTDIMNFLNNQYDGVINELALDILIDKNDNMYVSELNTKPGLIGDPDAYNKLQLTTDEKEKLQGLAIMHGKFLAKSLIHQERLNSMNNLENIDKNKEEKIDLNVHNENKNDDPPSNYIGMIYQERDESERKYIYGYMYQGFALERELVKHNYHLFCYSTSFVDKNKRTADGFVIKNGKFVPITLPIPKLNFDYHFRSATSTERQQAMYRNFEPWAAIEGYEIYPPKSIRRLTRDKLRTAEILAEYDPSIVPKTEHFTKNEEQIEKYLKDNHWAFIKPRFGRKGDDIFVVRKNDNQYLISYYYENNKNSLTVNTLLECIQFFSNNSKGNDYIIQEAIDCLSYEGSVLDIRTVVLNENKNFHFLSELVVGKKGNDVSNLFQDAQTYQLDEFFPKMFSKEKASIIIDKIKDFSIKAAAYLNQQYDNKINELAFDLLIDKQLNIYIAELNVKPGLVGMPMQYSNYYNMTDEEKYIYENVTLKHAAYLARSLLSRACCVQAKESEYWFQDIHSTISIDLENIKKISELIFKAIAERTYYIDSLPHVYQYDSEPRIIFVSVSDYVSKAKTFLGSGNGLLKAINSALELTTGLAKTFNIKALKIDVVQEVHVMRDHDIRKPLDFDRSLYGVAFDEKINLAYLPEVVVANTIINNENILRTRSIFKTSHLSTTQEVTLTKRNVFTLYQFRMQSFYKSEISDVPLYRGHRLYEKIETDLLLSSAISAGNYLQKSVNEKGEFLYEYLPKIDKFSKRYNVLRHAGSIYAMLELYELTKNEDLLKAAKLALTNLIERAESVTIKAEALLCIVEKGFVKLGANALTILALSKYISITKDTSYLNVAIKLALWMKFAQNASGNFYIHKQKFSNKKNTYFVSGYYPGEAIFSLIRLYQVDPNPLWLDMAQKAADYIIKVRDKDLNIAQLEHDHWLLYGLNELHRFREDPIYIDHTKKLTKAIISAQYRKSEPRDYLGGFYIPPRGTPTAARAEGMCAAYQLFKDNHFVAECNEILDTIKLCLQFQLQSQYLPERALYLINPMQSLGGFSRSLTDYSIRIDYVQHNLSSIIGLYKILKSID